MKQPENWTTISHPAPNRLGFRRLRLSVIVGPDQGRYVDFSTDSIRVGALPRNDLALTDRSVSALHFELDVDTRGVRLRDPGSTNGTRIDGVRVAEGYLHNGARIQLGDSILRLECLSGDEHLRLPAGDTYFGLVGASPCMRELYSRVERLASATLPVLILGETGSGKEAVARALHMRRSRGLPFVPVSCPAIPGELFESELFGYQRGAFTGADRSVPGAFERAGSGTLLLDEIGDMPLSMQPKLLGVLERKRLRPLGADADRAIDARVIAATNRDLPAAVAHGAFRADLYYRLSVGRLRVPPLRERPEDIPLLVQHFLRAFPGAPPISDETMARLMEHTWPGNVRELRNAVERIAVLGHPALREHCIAPSAGDDGPQLRIALDLPYADSRDQLLDAFRRAYVQHALKQSNGNVAKAARRAGVDRMTLYRILGRSSTA